MKLVLATRNRHKIDEMLDILGDLKGWEFLSLGQFSGAPEVEETGETLQENASLKVRHAFAATGRLCLAEDTGLEIDALNGRPGVRSARFAGEGARYDENVARVLELMSTVPADQRAARFRSVVAILGPGGEPTGRSDNRAAAAPGRQPGGEQVVQPRIFEGICPGRIITERLGTGGFGYDPIFVPNGFRETFAQMEAGEKNRISHRARALKGVREYLINLQNAPS